MKVLFLTYSPSPYRMDFFNEMGKYCDLTVTFENEGTSNRNKNWFNRTAITFKPVFLRGHQLKNGNAFCPEITKIIRKDYDRIIVSNYSTPTSMLAIEFLRFHHIPFWLEADGGMIANENKLKYLVKKHFISSASHWFSSGKVTSEYFAHYGANPEEIYLYPFTSLRESDILKKVPSEEEKMEIRHKLGIGGGRLVLSVGQFIYRKGFDILLKAWKNCPTEDKLLVIGDEPTEEMLSLKENLELCNIFFCGFKNKEELSNYYKASDLFVLPTREDIWGLVINEAMAYGLPVITTNRCVAGRELIDNGINGYLVPVNNIDALSNCINTALYGNLKEMATSCLNKIKDYSIENMAKAHIEGLLYYS